MAEEKNIAEKSFGEDAFAGTVKRRARRDTSNFVMVIWQALLFFALMGLWQFASGRLVEDFFISNPLTVVERLIQWTADGSLYANAWVTIYETIIGFVIGMAIGLALGLWLGIIPFVSRLLTPFIWALNALPKVAMAPLFILWFGLGVESKIALAAVFVLFIVFFNTFSGVRDVDQELIDMMRLMKGTRRQILIKLVIPSATSWIFTGFKIAMPISLIGAVIGEMIASNKGLGYLVQLSGAQFDAAGLFAVLVVIGIIAVVLNQSVEIAQRRLEKWRLVGE